MNKIQITLLITILPSLLFSQIQNIQSNTFRMTLSDKKDNIECSSSSININDIYKEKYNMKDKNVTFNAETTRVTRGEKGTIWVYLSDNTKNFKSNIVARSNATNLPQVGEVVKVKGILRTDVDLGQGYFFPVLIEEATFLNPN